MNLLNISDYATLVHYPVGMKDVQMTLVGDKVAWSLSNLEMSENSSYAKYFYDILKSLRWK